MSKERESVYVVITGPKGGVVFAGMASAIQIKDLPTMDGPVLEQTIREMVTAKEDPKTKPG